MLQLSVSSYTYCCSIVKAQFHFWTSLFEWCWLMCSFPVLLLNLLVPILCYVPMNISQLHSGAVFCLSRAVSDSLSEITAGSIIFHSTSVPYGNLVQAYDCSFSVNWLGFPWRKHIVNAFDFFHYVINFISDPSCYFLSLLSSVPPHTLFVSFP